MNTPDDKFSRDLEAAAEAHGMKAVCTSEPLDKFHFKAGARWGYERGKAERDELRTHLVLTNEGWTTQFATFDKLNSELAAARAEIERLQTEVVKRNQYKINQEYLDNIHAHYEKQINELKLLTESYRTKLAEAQKRAEYEQGCGNVDDELSVWREFAHVASEKK